MEKDMIKRFFEYIKIDTTSDENSEQTPSTDIQFNLAKVIIADLNALGLEEISLDENGYIMATLPSNTDKEVPTVGFIAHIDTAPSYSGTNVKPNIISNYDGKDIVLNKEKNIVLETKHFPEIKNYIGQSIIVTDGTTLLGGDNKAGIVEIIEAIKILKSKPEIKHGKIRIGFTPDEEIGRGANLFNVEKFGAKFAYTIDGGEIGELEYENFNAANMKIKFIGRDIHPGAAKDKMINAMLIAMEFNAMLPLNERPEFTSGYEGFFLLTGISGDVENCSSSYIIRDHSNEKFQIKKDLSLSIAKYLNEKYRDAKIEIEIKDSYYNMREKIEPVMNIVDIAQKSMLDVGVTPIISPIRGGTDGARLSYMNLPCPNIFTGGHNFHGKFEYIPIESMNKAVEVIVKLIENIAIYNWK
ncbi:MAG: peptidase T [Fusobacteriaceae bacterium]